MKALFGIVYTLVIALFCKLSAASASKDYDFSSRITEIDKLIDERGSSSFQLLNLALTLGNVNVIEYLFQREPDLADLAEKSDQGLVRALVDNSTEMAEVFLKYGANINKLSSNDMSPLMTLAYDRNIESLRFLLEHGAIVDFQNSKGDCALSLAARSGDLETVQLLLQAGAEPNLFNKSGTTPLMEAIHQNRIFGSGDYEGVARVLLEARTDVDAVDNKGDSALMLAVKYGKPGVARILIDHGADPNITNSVDESPVTLARRLNHVQIMTIFERNEHQ